MSYFSDIYPEVIPGVIIAWTSVNTEPDIKLFLECDGTVLNILPRYEPLFNVLGSLYGGNGTTTFALPDYRGRFLRHKSSSVNVGVFQSATLKNHSHTVPLGPYYGTGGGSYWNVQYLARFPYSAEIGKSSGTTSANVGSKVLPKTMHVKYYIGY